MLLTLWLLAAWSTATTTLAVNHDSRRLQRTEIPPRPDARFVAWSQLTPAAQNAATTQLGFTTSEQWNQPNVSAAVEQLDYGSLTADQRAGAATAMMIVETDVDAPDIWDCWINHYNGYDWIELGPADANVQEWYIALGWNQAFWDDGTGEPETEELDWEELTPDQQQAATYLCFEANTWNNVNLEDLVTVSPTAAPTTAAPTFAGQTREPTALPTTPFPTVTPTTGTPTMAPTDTPTVAYATPPAVPLRYTEWTALPTAVQTAVESDLLYTPDSWNEVGANVIEDSAFEALTTAQQATVTDTLEWTEPQWNCHVNHYNDFTWQELNTEQQVQQFWRALGWSEAAWVGQSPPPPSEDASWAELTVDEQAAASQLCYFEALWNGLDLSDGTTTLAPTTPPPNSATSRPGTLFTTLMALSLSWLLLSMKL